MKKKVFKQLAVLGLTAFMTMSFAACGSAAAPSVSGSEGSTQQSTQNAAQNDVQNTTQEESSQVSDKEQEPSSAEDLFVAFVNAPNTDVNGFGDITDMEKLKEFIEKQGMTIGEEEVRPIGDLYLYSDISSFDMDGTGDEENLLEIRMQTADSDSGDAYWNMANNTRYVYAEGMIEVDTTLFGVDQMTAAEIPAIGGFAGFLAENNCLSIEELLELIGLDDEELMKTLATVDIEETAYYEMEADTSYGRVEIEASVTSDLADDNEDTPATIKELYIFFREDDAPFYYICIEDSDYGKLVIDDEGTVGGAYYGIGGHSLTVGGVISW